MSRNRNHSELPRPAFSWASFCWASATSVSWRSCESSFPLCSSFEDTCRSHAGCKHSYEYLSALAWTPLNHLELATQHSRICYDIEENQKLQLLPLVVLPLLQCVLNVNLVSSLLSGRASFLVFASSRAPVGTPGQKTVRKAHRDPSHEFSRRIPVARNDLSVPTF